MTIRIDLADLSPAHVEQAMPHLGKVCDYASPCILGTLMPEGVREKFGDRSIIDLVESGEVEMPAEQVALASLLQYDHFRKPHYFEETLAEVRDAFATVMA